MALARVFSTRVISNIRKRHVVAVSRPRGILSLCSIQLKIDSFWLYYKGRDFKSRFFLVMDSSALNENGIPRSKVELHLHLDCSIRVTTIWDLIRKKGLYPEFTTIELLKEACHVKRPNTLADFLKACKIAVDAIKGDAEALERVAYELCEDEAKDGVLYFEARYSPHLSSAVRGETNSLSPEEVIHCVNRGLKRGQADFKIKARTILCCIRGHPEWSDEVLDLCIKFQNDGVVGIDIAGDEKSCFASKTDIEVFKRAKEHGIHRTVHAAEAGPPENASIAMDEMFAERIGHGYHIVQDPKIYNKALTSRIHFETCPHSSYLTGSVPPNESHPIIRFAMDNAKFSISKDDTTPIGKTLDEEYDLLRELGLKEVHFARANFNAAMASFLEKDEKRELIMELMKTYGVPLEF